MLDRERLKLAACLWLAGMTGVVALSWGVLPRLLQTLPSSLPLPVAVTINMLQSAALVGLAVWVGTVLAKPVGLHAPVTESALTGTGTWRALKPQMLPATVVGLVVGVLLARLTVLSPEPLRVLSAEVDVPVWVRLLYGGITEEILMRWGLMTALLWSLWRVLQKRAMDVTKLLLPYEPTEFVSALAAHKAANPDFGIEAVHFFPLGGIKTNATWTTENGGASGRPANA